MERKKLTRKNPIGRPRGTVISEKNIRFRLPEVLHDRLRAVCAYNGQTLSDLIRNTLADRVEYLEAKQRMEATRAQADLEARRLARAPKKPLTPREALAQRRPVTDPPAEERKLPAEYAIHAALIYEAIVGGDTTEKRLRTMEAVAAIKKRNPLLHPPEPEILATLEKMVRQLDAEARGAQAPMLPTIPATPAATRVPIGAPTESSAATVPDEGDDEGSPDDIIIDTSKMTTFGDV